jgi:hypothetical protein
MTNIKMTFAPDWARRLSLALGGLVLTSRPRAQSHFQRC